jgi:hypothetical protein
MVNPSIMCRPHLLGEHNEIHMFIGSAKKGISLTGYVNNNLLQWTAIYGRHEQLVQEMLARGYNHKSNITLTEIVNIKVSVYVNLAVIDRMEALQELLSRCETCRNNYIELIKQKRETRRNKNGYIRKRIKENNIF